MREWILENERYDAQCRITRGTICSQCGERYGEDDITYIDGRAICCDCLKEYISEYGRDRVEDFAEDFISEHIKARVADYWENDMSEQQREEIMRLAYLQAKQMHKDSEMHDIEDSDRDFCLASDDYTEFMRDRLCW